MMRKMLMPLNEFRDRGYLQEVNRQFFHPLGLALFVEMDEDGDVARIGGIMVADDPDGYMLKRVDFDKAAFVQAEWDKRADLRRRLFEGAVVQPVVSNESG